MVMDYGLCCENDILIFLRLLPLDFDNIIFILRLLINTLVAIKSLVDWERVEQFAWSLHVAFTILI